MANTYCLYFIPQSEYLLPRHFITSCFPAFIIDKRNAINMNEPAKGKDNEYKEL